MGAAQEFRGNWRLLLSVFACGLPISIPLYTTGIFMPVWEQEFGWSRAEIALGISCYMLALVMTSPFLGAVIDRFNARRPILISVVGGLVAIAAISRVGGSIWTLYITYFLFGLVSSACAPAGLTRPISLAFDKGRGLAFGITLSATTLCMLLVPPITYALYADHGWRTTYLLLAMGLTPVLLIGYWGLRERGADSRQEGGKDAEQAERPGLTLAAASRMPIFWLLASSFSLTVFVSTGASGQIVPILTDNGFTAQQAVLMQPAMAVGLGISRLLVGTLLDRMSAIRIYSVMCCAAALGFVALISPYPMLTVPSIFIIGAALGAEFDILAYMVSRYFGLAHYGRIFAIIYAGNIVRAMLGPLYFASMYDANGNYHLALLLAAVILLAAALLLVRIGPYPDWSKR